MNIILLIVLLILGNGIVIKFIEYCSQNSISNSLIFGGFYAIAIAIAFIYALYIKSLKKNNEKHKKYFNIEKINDEFKIIYDKLEKENFQILERLRKKLIVIYVCEYVFSALAISIFLMMGIIIINLNDDNVWNFIFTQAKISTLSLIFAIGFICLRQEYKIKYIETYKQDVVSFFVRLLDPDYKYNFKKREHGQMEGTYYRCITPTEKEYNKVNFDGMRADYVLEDDWIQKELNENEFFQITDIKAIRRYGNIYTSNLEKIIFEGIFFWIDSSKNINTTLKISINKENLARISRKNQVIMDSSEFESVFDIYSEDRILAMRILTTDIMELLMDFYREYYIPFEIYYLNNKIYIRFFIKNMFEPQILGSSMDIKTLYIYYRILEFAMEFSRKINNITKDIEI